MAVVEIIVPQRARTSDVLEGGLVRLTEEIWKRDKNLVSAGLLGGRFGYGATWDSDVFQMHAYCWCEDVLACPWCYGCNCPMDGPKCDWCRGVVRYTDRGALAPDQYPHAAAPHFWHKPSGYRVWWYKWIGRGMEVVAPKGAHASRIIRDCIASVRAAPEPSDG